MPVRGAGEDLRAREIRAEPRDPPPGYRGRKDPNPQSFERGPYYPTEGRASPRASEPYTAYKLSDMEKQTIILEKAAPDQGFGIAVSGGLDNPHYETGDTSIIVSDVVERSPADGLLRMNDVILNVNGVNVEGVEHSVAVEALKNSGYSVKLVILRKRPSTATSSPTSIPSIQEPPQAQRRPPIETSKEPRNVILNKMSSESYGLSLGTILFVKDLDERGPAGREGQLERGDVILKINDKRVDDLSRPDAVNIMRNAPERLDLVVLRNKDVPANMPARFAGVNEHVSMTKSQMVESSSNGMNGQDLIAFKQDGGWDSTLRSTATYSISSAGRRSDERERDIDARRDKKFHGEPHLVSFHRTGSSLGIQVAGGNAVGIFANAIKDGSPAQVAGLRVGDQVLSANDIDFKDITREEAVLILLSLPEEVSLLVQYKKSVYDKSKDSPGDSFYVKAQFHYQGSDEDELSFRRGEVFHVLDTMNGGTIGSWRAQRVLQSGAETEVGIIPNKCRAEQLAIAQDLEAKKGANPKQKSGTLKRKDTKSNTPKKKQYQAADQLDETSFQLDVKYPAYERVVKQKAGFVRPVVLLGPIADICRDKLMVEYSDKFTSPATFGRMDPSKQSGIKLSAVRDNIASGKHSLLDVTPDGVEMLNFVGLEPIVIFMQPSSKQLIKDLRHDLTNKSHSARFVKKLFDQADTLSLEYPYLFTAVIPLERNNKWYTDCVDIIKKQQEDPIWLPETLSQQHNDDEVVLQMPRRSVGYDMEQSGLDLPGDLDRKPESYPNTPDEEVVVAASAAGLQAEEVPVVQAFSVTPEVSERERREEEEREFQRKQEQEREFQRKQEQEFQEREFLRRQEEEREFQRKKEEELRIQEEENRRQAEMDREREKEQNRDRPEDEYARQLEQREYERRQYEENRRSYDGGEVQHRDERKPYIPPGVKVLPGALPPLVSLKKTDSGDRRSPRDESYPGDARPAVQLRHVERDQDADQYDERIGVKVSDLFDIGKDIQAGGEYQEDNRRVERKNEERRYRSDSDDEEAGFPREPPESRVTNTQDVEKHGELIHENMVRTTVKPVEAAAVDFEDVFSSQKSTNIRNQTTTEYRTSYQVTKQARNTIVDTRGGQRVESGVFSEYYPGRSRAKFVNIGEDKQDGYGGREEPQVKMEYASRVSSEPPSYDRRPPPPNHYESEPPPSRRPPPPAEDQGPNRPMPYSNVYPRPFGTQSSTYYSDYRRTTTDHDEGRQYNGDYQQPVPESATYRYGSAAYRYPANDYDDERGEATSDFESVGDDEPTVVATARGYFTSRGGILTSQETGVSIYIPSGAIPPGIEQEIYFKVGSDNSMLPPLDSEKGETLLSPLVMCGPHGTKFLKPVELRLPHSASMTPDGWSFSLNSSNNSSGEPKQYKVGSNSVSVLVDHF
ncbi:tight junction protein ZO-1-like isoform X2 [Dendronephthya gigantea]|uniref:tight junction protein ZO-1-like isoform X2 n=1 Tax=Dendronephthya gigantea TaxID=151771 RepID=UPI0010693006|nr:tight junction protein ZO-1-like isoform X2 [Dendronephthya gigantea]